MLTTLSVIIWTGFLITGCVLGWLLRSRHAVSEKAAISEGWREQLDAQIKERSRLELQGKAQMQQISDLQQRNRELSDTNRRQADSLEQQETARQSAAQKLEAAERRMVELERHGGGDADRQNRLEQELRKWQQRLPPLIERFRERDRAATRAESELEELRAELERYRAQPSFDETRAGAFRPGELDALSDASNDTSMNTAAALLEIRGIGPAISAKLGLLGISTLEQLASLTPDDEARIGDAIRGSHGKLSDWQAQARALLGADAAE